MGRLIRDRMSYRNHYMCSGEATSIRLLQNKRPVRFDHYFESKCILKGAAPVLMFEDGGVTRYVDQSSLNMDW